MVTMVESHGHIGGSGAVTLYINALYINAIIIIFEKLLVTVNTVILLP